MPITLLDIILLVVMLISALLAMVRGFMREVLSIASWAAAAVAHPLRLSPKLMPIAQQYFNNDIVAAGIVHRRRLPRHAAHRFDHHGQDLRHDPRQPGRRARPHARASCSGSARGLIIVVVAFLFFAWLVPDRSQPDWVKNAKSQRRAERHRRWLDVDVAGRPRKHHLEAVEAQQAGRTGASRTLRRPAVPSLAMRRTGRFAAAAPKL